jgi:hypothetical protein
MKCVGRLSYTALLTEVNISTSSLCTSGSRLRYPSFFILLEYMLYSPLPQFVYLFYNWNKQEEAENASFGVSTISIQYFNKILAVYRSSVSLSRLHKCKISNPAIRYPFLHGARRNPRRYHAISWGRDVDRSFSFLTAVCISSPLWSAQYTV